MKPDLEWKAGTSPANGIELAWEQAGPDNGEPVMLLMGLSWQLIHWPESFCADLVARGFRVIRFDNRDVGLSSNDREHVRFHLLRDTARAKLRRPVRANYTLHDMAEDTRGLMDALELRRAHLVGLSMGGMIAQLVAGKHPERVLSLTTLMSGTNHPWHPMPKLRVLRNLLQPLPPEPTREQVVARSVRGLQDLAGGRIAMTPEEREALAARAYDRAFRPAGFLRQTHAVTATGSVESVLRDVRAPTQVIHGLDDPMLAPVGSKRIAKLVRGARLELIPGLGHDLPTRIMPRYAELIAANAARA